MLIKTKRLQLSPVTMDDLNDVHELHSMPETDRYNTLGIPHNLDETRKLTGGWLDARAQSPINKQVLRISTNENRFVGLFGINIGKAHYRTAEIWYKIHPVQWNNGYATESLKHILEYCFNTLNLHRITAGCSTANTASIKVLEKAGFTREGLHRKILPIRGEWHDNYEYAILHEDFKND